MNFLNGELRVVRYDYYVSDILNPVPLMFTERTAAQADKKDIIISNDKIKNIFLKCQGQF